MAATPMTAESAPKHRSRLATNDAQKDGSEWSATSWFASGPACAVIGDVLLSGCREAGDEDDLTAVRRLADSICANDKNGAALLADRLRESGVVDKLAAALWPQLHQLQVTPTHNELQDRFSKFVAAGSGFTLEFRSLEDFFEGLEGQVGKPDPLIGKAMATEHTARADSEREFTTDNYGITTRPRVEWEFVSRSKAEAVFEWPVESRGAEPRVWLSREALASRLDDLNAELEAKGAQGLMLEEATGARLYTGPMFIKVCTRGLPSGTSRPVALSVCPRRPAMHSTMRCCGASTASRLGCATSSSAKTRAGPTSRRTSASSSSRPTMRPPHCSAAPRAARSPSRSCAGAPLDSTRTRRPSTLSTAAC